MPNSKYFNDKGFVAVRRPDGNVVYSDVKWNDFKIYMKAKEKINEIKNKIIGGKNV